MELYKKFKERLSEVRDDVEKVDLFSITLNSIILFLASIILLHFFNFLWVFAVIPSVIYFTLNFLWKEKGMDKEIILRICGSCPELNEKLKTAYDNIKIRDNIIVEKLINEVSNDINLLESSRFFRINKILWKIFTIIALTFIFLSMTTINFSIYTSKFNPWELLKGIRTTGINFPIQIIPQGNSNHEEWETSNYTTKEEKERLGGEGGGEMPGFSKGPIPGFGGGAGSEEGRDIFGEKSSAKISGEDIKMKLYPEYGGEIEIKEEKRREISDEIMITEAKGAKIPHEEPLEYEGIIKRYFEKLLKEEESKE